MSHDSLNEWRYPFWIGHRGAGKEAPENTLAAFRHGWAVGFRMFECDVKLSADGVPYLLHDARLDRTTSGHGLVAKSTWPELAQLDAGSWHSAAYSGEPLARLDELAAWCIQQGAMLNIEIKPVPGDEVETGAAVAEAVRALWAHCAIKPLLSSFQPKALEAAQLAAPELPRALLLDCTWEGWINTADHLQCVALVCHYPLIEPPLIQTARMNGWRMLAYTVNDEAESRRLQALNVDGLITDNLRLPSKNLQSHVISEIDP